MRVLDKLDELVAEHGKPMLVYTNYSFFNEVLLKEFPEQYEMNMIQDNVNQIPYGDILIINKFTDFIYRTFKLSSDLLNAIHEYRDNNPVDQDFCFFIFPDSSYKRLKL